MWLLNKKHLQLRAQNSTSGQIMPHAVTYGVAIESSTLLLIIQQHAIHPFPLSACHFGGVSERNYRLSLLDIASPISNIISGKYMRFKVNYKQQDYITVLWENGVNFA